MAFMSANIVAGEGLGIVIGTGDSTVIGKLSKLSTSQANQDTLLQKEIRRVIDF